MHGIGRYPVALAQGITIRRNRNNSQYTLNLCINSIFKYCQLLSSITFKRFKIEMLSLKRAFQKCMTRGGSPQGASQNAESVVFWSYFFAHSHFLPLLLTSPLLSPTSSIQRRRAIEALEARAPPVLRLWS